MAKMHETASVTSIHQINDQQSQAHFEQHCGLPGFITELVICSWRYDFISIFCENLSPIILYIQHIACMQFNLKYID